MGWHWGILASSGGAAGAYDLLETTVLGTSTASVTFSNLNNYSGYKHLQLRLSLRSASGFAVGSLRFNGINTANNYAHHRLYGNGSSVVSTAAGTNADKIEFYYSANTNIFSGHIIEILDFSSSNKNTTTRMFASWEDGSSRQVMLWSGTTLFTNAITSIELSGSSNFAASSRFSLYGVK